MSHTSPFTAEEEREISRIQQEWITERAEGRALHIGCGMKPIAGAINTDPNPDRWAWADVACDAHALPFADGCLDSVVSNHVIPHLRHPLVALREMARVLRPGGVMAHVIPDLRYAPQRIEPHYPFAHQPHGWYGPLNFIPEVMIKMQDMFKTTEAEVFTEFDWSFKVGAVRL